MKRVLIGMWFCWQEPAITTKLMTAGYRQGSWFKAVPLWPIIGLKRPSAVLNARYLLFRQPVHLNQHYQPLLAYQILCVVCSTAGTRYLTFSCCKFRKHINVCIQKVNFQHAFSFIHSVFAECNTILSPDSFYKACVFDSCHIPNPAIECTSLQAYAAACAQAGLCIHWRNHTTLCGKLHFIVVCLFGFSKMQGSGRTFFSLLRERKLHKLLHIYLFEIIPKQFFVFHFQQVTVHQTKSTNHVVHQSS